MQPTLSPMLQVISALPCPLAIGVAVPQTAVQGTQPCLPRSQESRHHLFLMASTTSAPADRFTRMRSMPATRGIRRQQPAIPGSSDLLQTKFAGAVAMSSTSLAALLLPVLCQRTTQCCAAAPCQVLLKQHAHCWLTPRYRSQGGSAGSAAVHLCCVSRGYGHHASGATALVGRGALYGSVELLDCG